MTFLLDTREPGGDGSPHPWECFLPAGAKLVRGTLETGDVALAALPDGAVVERKTVPDFLAAVGRERERFDREVRRARHLGAFVIIVEGNIAQMLNNKDFYNVEIRHEGDPLLKQVADEAKFIGKSFVPFSLQGMHKRQETGPLAKTESFLGVTPAPAELARTPAMQAMHEAIVAKMPGGTKTREEADRADFRRTLMDAERHGQSVNQEIADAVRDKRLTFKQGENIRADGWTDPRYVAFKHLSLDDAERVYRLGTPEEKALWKGLLMMKGTKQNRAGEIRALLSAGK